MALKKIISREKALERSLTDINRRLTDALYDDPSENGQTVQALRARRAAIKARQQP